MLYVIKINPTLYDEKENIRVYLIYSTASILLFPVVDMRDQLIVAGT